MHSETDLARQYCAYLEEIKRRLALVRGITRGAIGVGSEAHNYEVVSVNFRKVLELIAFGSLTANKSAYSAAYADFAKHWNAKRLLKNLERIHPEFYPKPLLPPDVQSEGPRHLHFELLSDGFLTREEFVELYNLSSQTIHTRNPFSETTTTIDFRISVSDWIIRIESLLRLHLLRLAGTQHVWVAELSSPGDNKAHAYVANPTEKRES